MIRDIVVYPDKRLKAVSKEVVDFDSSLHALLDDMYETMVAKNGVGLAAIQVGVDLRVLIINIPIKDKEKGQDQPKDNTLEVINPIFLEEEGKSRYEEGCLSVPGYYEYVDRYKKVKIEYQDRNGIKHIIEDDDFLSIAIQHEIDHLNGRVFIEKLSILKRKKFEKEWKNRKS
ncbi:Peptide deformylase [Sulfurovum sp. enrichment culture clone C5]|uniref:Peptide deformylase n=1 Tax=Sulfurovum sp. enrichment culture clone C5 TaxID=497650 RepID=A0A0S4XNR4_9BACT|nr:Peptide deformylase [Sulfurovum sp. enrichment culture clone C5]